MPFKLVSKEEANAEHTTSMHLKFIGDDAIQLKKLAEEAKVTIVEAASQMVKYCLKEARKEAPKA